MLRDTHSVSLTADGEAMVGFARNIVAASEQAAAYFSGDRPSGRLRIGIADDLALTPVAADPGATSAGTTLWSISTSGWK